MTLRFSHRALVDRAVPLREATLTAHQVARWLSAYRNTHDTRPWQRVATPFVQAVMALRWFKEATDLRILARDARVSIATAYRYLHEAIDVIADQALDLPDVLADGLRQGRAFVCLDGTLIPCTRVSAPVRPAASTRSAVRPAGHGRTRDGRAGRRTTRFSDLRPGLRSARLW
jgi:hypothetical protein